VAQLRNAADYQQAYDTITEIAADLDPQNVKLVCLGKPNA
jgi:hypothetical protein